MRVHVYVIKVKVGFLQVLRDSCVREDASDDDNLDFIT